MEAERPEVVRVERLVKEVRPGFGLRRRRLLDGISLSVREGEIFGFVGPNGAGKTTTLKILMGLIRPTSGSARILGHDVGENAFRRTVGFLPENPYFYPFLTGREILRFYGGLSGVRGRALGKRVEELVSWVGLAEAADARLRTYSKGMLQRIGIAQALVHDPRVVFLDEPMSGLDPMGRKEIRDLILRLRVEGKTVFMNTHILSDVEMVCDRVAIIAKGRIRYQGRIEGFLDRDEEMVDLVLSSVSPELGDELGHRDGVSMRGHGERVELRVPAKHTEEVLEAALGHGARVLSLTPHRVSLESIFLSAVQGEAAKGGSE